MIHFFTSFALVQKEVTPEFIAEILEWDKEVVYEYIFKYIKWFSVSGNNQFRLYHDRFRVYILQKVSESDLTQFNQLFISLCESELTNNTEKDIPEKERYALEFLSPTSF